MKYLKNMCVLLLAFAATFVTAAPVKQFIELKKTDNYFSLNVHFEKCDTPSTFLIQDGAMNTIKFGSDPAIRFIVKKSSDGKVIYHLVTDEVYVSNGERVPGLKIQPGVSFDAAESAAALKSAAVKSLKIVELGSDSDLVKSAQARDSSKRNAGTPTTFNDTPTPEEKCCGGKGCGDTYFHFCTTGGSGCGGDGCGFCCIGNK
ncbi:hypothetical protein [Massilia eurypsychrophila]|uniref:hypothetical protein n=1 Tax=Massilia eurypsychrophila TaxID=1485217 RepID=UPI0010350309|nr:hypothetical protein [Massilia eurypsychrophila]